MNDAKLFVIGDENAVFGFALFGVAGQVVQNVEEARQALNTALTDASVAMIFLTDEWAATMRAEVDRHMATVATPLLVEIPSSQPNPARQSLRDLLQGALGIRLEG
ncbi:MAG: V-type ATP synthase subunit F [Caldilineaceae bacterium]